MWPDSHRFTGIRGHSDTVWSALWSYDGQQLLLCGNDGTAQVWTAPPA
ncbi:WD40 repeat domain-containing protein [Thermogemmatispora sp.]